MKIETIGIKNKQVLLKLDADQLDQLDKAYHKFIRLAGMHISRGEFIRNILEDKLNKFTDMTNIEAAIQLIRSNGILIQSVDSFIGDLTIKYLVKKYIAGDVIPLTEKGMLDFAHTLKLKAFW